MFVKLISSFNQPCYDDWKLPKLCEFQVDIFVLFTKQNLSYVGIIVK